MKSAMGLVFAVLMLGVLNVGSAEAQGMCEMPTQTRCGEELPLLVDRDISDDAPDYGMVWEAPYVSASTVDFDLAETGDAECTFNYCIEVTSGHGHLTQWRGSLDFEQTDGEVVSTSLNAFGNPRYGDDTPTINLLYTPPGTSQSMVASSDMMFFPQNDTELGRFMELMIVLYPWASVSSVDPNHALVRGTWVCNSL